MSTVDATGRDDVKHGRRFLILWVVLSLIAWPIAAFVIGPLIPPGNGSVQAQGQTFDNQVLIAVCAPILVFVVLALAYTLIVFRERDSAVAGPPVRGDSGLQLWWIVITSVTVLGLAAFGTYELIKDEFDCRAQPPIMVKGAGCTEIWHVVGRL